MTKWSILRLVTVQEGGERSMKKMILDKDTTPHEEGCPVKPHSARWYKYWKEICPVCNAPASVSTTLVNDEAVEVPFIRQKSLTDSQI